MHAEIAIVGGGAAGLMAALRAAERGGGARGAIVVVDAARDVGRKILVSGGGRCNVLPMVDAPERFVSSSPPRLVRRFLGRLPLREQRAFFEELLGGPLREEPETMKLFPPTNRAKDVRDALRGRVQSSGALLRLGSPVTGLERRPDGFFGLALAGEDITARCVLVTTGGLSVLGAGADAGGLEWAAALGHTIRPTYPALAPIVALGAPHAFLSGVSLTARVEARDEGISAAATGGFLFTHRGYSGPAVLDVSHVVERAKEAGARAEVRVCFRPGDGAVACDWDETLRTGAGKLSTFLKKRLPDRLVDALLAQAGVEDVPLHRLTRASRGAVVEALERWVLPADGTEGYRTAEVMGGGIALEEVDPATGESRLVPGLYFAGEILDAFGPIGGFNFQWAWSTGWAAGEGLASACA